ncbi:MAG: hypothetical protein ACJ739_06705 [Acidimicrobiales bacterium]
MADAFDVDEVRAAEALDAEIDRVIGGAARLTTEPVVALLATAIRVDPPSDLARRVRAEHARLEQVRWRPAQVAAAVLATLLVSQGLGNLVNGAWIARGIGEDFSPHTMREGGFALIGLGLAVAAGVLRRSWLPISVVAGVPVGLALGVNGTSEIGHFAAGALLHTTEALAAIALVVTFWRARRYARRPDPEGGA